MPWYKAGTVSVVQNSNAVTGAGTAFIANSRVGDAFRGPDGGWYEITNIASNTALSIAPNYQGATTAAGIYALAPMQGYVKDSADALRALVNQFGATLAALGTASTATVTTSITDATLGRLLKVGDFGMALPAGAQCSAVGDANTATIPGAYRMGAPDLNKPAAGQGQLLVWKSYANYVLQMYVPATAAISNLWTRTSPDLGVTWTPWTTPAAGSTETDNLVVDPNGALGTGAFGGQVVSVVDRYSSGAPSLAPSKVLHKITFTNTNNQYSQVYLDPKRAAGVTSLDNAGAIAVRPGETYTVSFDGFADGVVGGRRIGAIAHCYQANTNVTNLNIAGPTVDANGAWTPYSFTFTVPADIYSIWVRLLAPSGVTTNLYVGNIRVEKLQPQPGLATSGANSNITSLAGLTTPLSVSQGGTGSSTASGALANLGAMPAAGGFYNPDFVSVKVGGTRPNLAAQGMHLLWNTAAGGLTGEGAFVCNKGGGTGGFSWRSIDTGNTTTGPTMTYTYAGVLNVPGAVNQNSDRRLKTNDIEIVDGLERILRVRPVEYDRRDSFDSEEYPHHEVGVIAQELFEIAPLLVTPANPDDAKDAWKVNYTGLIPYLVSAIKTLKAEIEELKSAGK